MKSNKKVLNKEQLQAVKHGEGPLLIIAGAGTGKTTVITERIKYLISSGKVKSADILALTFTQKASFEMEERVDKIVPFGYTQMWISTFHAFCDRLLRQEALHIGLDPNFTLLTESESLLFLRKNLFKFKLDYFRPAGNPFKFLKGMLTHFSRLKDEDISPSQYLRYAEALNRRLATLKNRIPVKAGNTENAEICKDEIRKTFELARVYEKYEELKKNEGVMDFSDLIANALKLFRQRGNVLNEYRQKFKYILVDEFQDTNIAQNELVILLTGKKANLTVVADDDQSIYKWRGASVSNVLQFKKNYSKAKIITLTKNYRSTQEILNRAYSLIQHNNPDRLEVGEKINKKLISVQKRSGDKIKFILTQRVEQEADIVVSEIEKLTSKDQKIYDLKDIAILVRANNHADSFVRAFLRKGIPFQFLGPGRLLRQEEVLDLIAYLKFLYNFEDNVAFFRILSLPIFKLSARDNAALRNYAKKLNLSFFEAAEQIKKISVSKKSKKQIAKITKMIQRHLKLIPKETAGQILYFFLEDTGLLKEIADFRSEKQEQKALNIAKFFDKLKTFEAEHENAGVEAVVDWLNLKMEMGESPLASDTDWTEENKVNILTVHSSKGLEFPVVFMVNLVSERFPTRDRKDQIPIPDSLIKEILPVGDSHEQEERRLFYVAMTRAKDRLYFTSSKYYGEGKRLKKVSPFVFEALGENLEKSTINQQHNQLLNQLSIFDFKPVKEHPAFSIKHPARKVIYLSYSQIDSFLRCPLQYKYRYIIKIPVPVFAAASFGTAIHNTLRNFYQQVLENKKPGKKDLLKFLKLNWINEGFSSKEHERKMKNRARIYLSRFYEKGFKKTDKPIALEQSFIIKVSPELRLGGRFDRVDRLKDESIEIIDYKTGKVPTQKQIDKDMQLTFYALAASNRGVYGKNTEEILLSFYFLENQEKLSSRRNSEDLKKAQKEIIKTKKEIESSDFLPKPGPYCDFCDYKLLCPAWK